MKSWKSALAALTLATGFVVAPLAHAGAIAVDAGWYGFCFGGAGSAAFVGGCQNEGIGQSGNSTTFTATGPVLFQITDAFRAGDTFDVWVDGLYQFTTSAVPQTEPDISNPDIAFADPAYSHGQILLGAGFHTIDVFANASPFGGGGAYLQVITARGVPEPGTVALIGIALAGLALRRRKDA